MPKKKKPLNRNKQLIRAFSILKTLLYKKSTTSIAKLSKQFKVHPKTIRRDLKAIEGAGFKLKRTYKDGKSKGGALTRALISLRTGSLI
ncbi:MAG: HTH domain-containing protein [Deltaproteobacteria bacterium]|nr:HTH domain-containing protein [Deltaproteobacteria bacterium]